MPSDLLGDWYREGDPYFSVTEDDFRVKGTLAIFQSISKSDSYYRIIYRISQQYHAIYLRDLTKEEVQIVHTDSTAVDEEGASAMPVSGLWLTLSSTNPWIAASMPGVMPGNWHIHDGKMEMVINRDTVVLDREVWEIDSVQTNRTVDRLILRSGEIYKSLYFSEVGEYDMGALLVDGKEDIQDRYGNVPGEWNTLYRWWDFIEKARLYPGSRWSYYYSYQEYYIQVYNISMSIDSIVQTNSLKGQFELEVTSSTIHEGTGSLTLQAAFQIDGGDGRYFHVQKDGTSEVLTDSSWTNPGHLKTEQYEIILENDTLWYKTEEGNVYFASTKLQLYVSWNQPGSLVNLRAFVYPFTFPREGFPEGRDIIGKIMIPHEDAPRPQGYGDVPGAMIISSGERTYVRGLYKNNYVYFLLGEGFQSVQSFHGDYDQRHWYGGPQYLNPYVKETSFSCKLVSFTPAY